ARRAHGTWRRHVHDDGVPPWPAHPGPRSRGVPGRRVIARRSRSRLLSRGEASEHGFVIRVVGEGEAHGLALAVHLLLPLHPHTARGVVPVGAGAGCLVGGAGPTLALSRDDPRRSRLSGDRQRLLADDAHRPILVARDGAVLGL